MVDVDKTSSLSVDTTVDTDVLRLVTVLAVATVVLVEVVVVVLPCDQFSYSKS